MKKQNFEIIDHTADLGLVARGETLAEAYANAAYGMFSIMVDLEAVQEDEFRRVELAEDDEEALLFEWLNSLIYLFEVEMLLLKRFDITDFNDNRLTALCYGERYDAARHRLRTGVKSATYHLLEVDRKNPRVQVIFDI